MDFTTQEKANAGKEAATHAHITTNVPSSEYYSRRPYVSLVELSCSGTIRTPLRCAAWPSSSRAGRRDGEDGPMRLGEMQL